MVHRMPDEGAGRRRAELEAEVQARVDAGWHIVDRTDLEATLLHIATRCWWRTAFDALLTLTASTATPSRERYLNIRSLEPGLLYRATIGDLPSGWKRNEPWEVADGPVSV